MEPSIDPDVLAGTALERLAADLAGEVDHDAIAVLDLATLALGGIRRGSLGDPSDCFIDLGLGHLGHQPLELDAA